MTLEQTGQDSKMATTEFLENLKKLTGGLNELAGIGKGTISGDTSNLPSGTFTGIRASDGRQQIINDKGQTEFISNTEALERGFINENDRDATGVRRFDSFRDVTNQNLIGLGQSVIDRANEITTLNKDLNKQIEIRENQRNENFDIFKRELEAVDQRLSGQLVEVGKSVQDAQQGGPGGIALPIIGAVSTGALIVGGIALYFILRR